MLYENVDGVVFDTRGLDYKSIGENLELRKTEKNAAQTVINLYNSSEFKAGVTSINAYSNPKRNNREEQRHQADHYITLEKLERVVRDKRLVRKLIPLEVLKKHPTFYCVQPGHPQTPYKLNADLL